VLISGTAGTGKSSMAAHFAVAACQRGERCLYFAFEESASQITRNMRSIGIDLQPWVNQGLLRFSASRPTAYGLEMHVAKMQKLIEEFKPHAVVIDPLTNLMNIGSQNEVQAALLRLIDLLKLRQITGFFTSLSHDGQALESTEIGISSIMDTWLLLRDIESNGERNRGLYVLKSRGMAHSNQIREFRLTNHGVELIPAYLGPAGVLTGTARLAQENSERAEALTRKQEIQQRHAQLERKRKTLAAQVDALRASFEAEEHELNRIIEQSQLRETMVTDERRNMGRLRQSEVGLTEKQPTTDRTRWTNEQTIPKESRKKTSSKRNRQ
jgi:circadian clock protein KaiC